jgi:cobalt-zinc-cadmium efflux system outer membrane protein
MDAAMIFMKTCFILLLLVPCLALQAGVVDALDGVEIPEGPTSERLAELTKHSIDRKPIKLEEYLDKVVSSNLAYASNRYNVTIAQTVVAAAKLFQNPVLQFGIAHDLTYYGRQELPSNYQYMLSQTFELGGKRHKRWLVARKTYAATSSTLQSFLQNLRLDASAAYADAIALGKMAAQFKRTSTLLRELLLAQEELQKAGDISDVDLLQTRVEVRQFEAELIDALAQANNAELELNAYLGPQYSSTHWYPVGTLDVTTQSTGFVKELTSAILNRPDLVALRHLRDAALANINLEKAKRVPDVNVGFGWIRSTSSYNDTNPQPLYNMGAWQISVPLPVWNRNKTGIDAAKAGASQSQLQLDDAELQAAVDVRQAISLYGTAHERVELYQSGVLKDVDAELEKRVISYKRGGSSLLELLDAQRKANEVWMSFYTAQIDHVHAVIALNRSTGKWIAHL